MVATDSPIPAWDVVLELQKGVVLLHPTVVAVVIRPSTEGQA